MMTKDEQRAQELDTYLTAQFQDRPSPAVNDEIQAEVTLAAELLQLASETEPEAAFLADLEAQLKSAAAGQDKLIRGKDRARRASFSHNIIAAIKEGFTMKRIGFAFGALAVLLVAGYLIWSMGPGRLVDEPERVADAGETVPAESETTEQPASETPAETTVASPLPPLPALAGASGIGSGMGGGGVEDSSMAIGSDLIFIDPLENAELSLNVALPADPTSLPVYQQPLTGLFTLEDALRLADLFNLPGPAYQDVYPEPEGVDEAWTPEPFYHFFDGQRQLSVGSTHLYYHDGSASPDGQAEMMPADAAQPIAEAFLQERGLLDFDYQVLSPNGFDIEFRRVINGYTVTFPEFQAAVNAEGQVWMVSYSPLSQLAALGDYPLRTAQAAWDLIGTNGVDFQQVFVSIFPEEMGEVMPLPIEGDYRYWQRSYDDGDPITLYPYPTVYMPVGDDSAPRILVDQYLLRGPDEELRAIAGQVGQQIFLTGTVRQTEAGPAIELGQWDPGVNQEFTFVEGSFQRDGDRALLVTDQGESYAIPDAPADVVEGERIYLSGWIGSGAGDGLPVFNWQSMGPAGPPESLPEPIEPDPAESTVIEPDRPVSETRQISIDGVDLIYVTNPVYDEGNSNPRFLVQPAWRFTGHSDAGERIEIYVQAVEPALVATPVPTP